MQRGIMDWLRIRCLSGLSLLLLPKNSLAYLPSTSTSLFRRVGTSTLVASRCRWAPKLALESTGSGEIGAPQLESTLVIPAGEQGPPKSSSETLASLPWQANGYSWWDYKGHRINYVDQGDKDKPAVVLIHGFGASAYHWRYNIPALVDAGYRVLALDLLGFGLSDKPVQEYSVVVWRDQGGDGSEDADMCKCVVLNGGAQVCAFVKEVVGADAVVVGNSLGGFTALAAASYAPETIKGCVLLNGAGRFRDRELEAIMEARKRAMEEAAAKPKPPFLLAWDEAIKWVGMSFQRALVRASFYYTKQPARIRQVLCQVYTDSRNVDDELVESIRLPSMHPNAAEVFGLVISRTGQPGVTVDDLLEGFKSPLLLLWGNLDPWIRPTAADKIQLLYPAAERVGVNAGHCPHDEAPEVVNPALVKWLESIGYKRV